MQLRHSPFHEQQPFRSWEPKFGTSSGPARYVAWRCRRERAGLRVAAHRARPGRLVWVGLARLGKLLGSLKAAQYLLSKRA